MKIPLVSVTLAVTVFTVQLTIGQREQEPEALQGANQEVVGHVIVMVASGRETWPVLSQCIHGKNGGVSESSSAAALIV